VDAVRQAEQLEAIKERVIPNYIRAESPLVKAAEVAPVAEVLGVDNPDDRERSKLQFIKDQLQADSATDLKLQLRQLEQMLIPAASERNRLEVIYNYLRARQEAHRSQKLMESYENGAR
jgi:hypothetical protein